METTSNKDKARELAIKYENLCVIDLEDLALQAMDWKDEKFQEVLDYAETCYGVFAFEQRENFINHIKEIYYKK